MGIIGVYIIRSLIKPSRIYVGSSFNISDRIKSHLYNLKHGRHHSIKLQNHYNKYGESDIVFEIIETYENISKDFLLQKEQDAYSIFNQNNKGLPYFNICPNARSRKGTTISKSHRQALLKSLIGHEVSEETRRKISVANKGRKLGEEHRRKTGMASKGRLHTEAYKQMMRLKMTGRSFSAESIEKMRIGQKNRKTPFLKGENHPMYGKHHSEATKLLLRSQRQGIPCLYKAKPVLQYSLDGVFIREFSSIAEAKRILGVSDGNISGCCLGRYGRKSVGGFKWKYKE